MLHNVPARCGASMAHHSYDDSTYQYVSILWEGAMCSAVKQHHGDEGIERLKKMMNALKSDVQSKLSKNRAMS